MPYKYKAFLSHSSEDKKIAEQFHEALEEYKLSQELKRLEKKNVFLYILDFLVDVNPKKFKGKIWFDKKEFRKESRPDLKATITEELCKSEYLIVLCSPNARQSEWVDFEIETFCSFGRSKKIIAILIEGQPAGGVEPERTESDPIHPRLTKTKWLDFRNREAPTFDEVITETVRVLENLGDAELTQRQDEQKKKNWSRIRNRLSLLLVLLIISFIGFIQFYRESLKSKKAEQVAEVAIEKEAIVTRVNLINQASQKAITDYKNLTITGDEALFVTTLAATIGLETNEFTPLQNFINLGSEAPIWGETLSSYDEWVLFTTWNETTDLLAIGTEKKIALWERESDATFKHLTDLNTIGQAIALHPKQQILASGSDSGEIILWTTNRLTKLRELRGHSDRVTYVAFDTSGNYMLSSDEKGNLTLWDFEQEKPLFKYNDILSRPTGIVYSAFTKSFIISDLQGKIYTLPVQPSISDQLEKIIETTKPINKLATNPTGTSIVYTEGSNNLRLYSFDRDLTTTRSKLFNSSISALHFPTEEHIMLGTRAGDLFVVATETLDISLSYQPQTNTVSSLSFVNGYIIAGNYNGSVKTFKYAPDIIHLNPFIQKQISQDGLSVSEIHLYTPTNQVVLPLTISNLSELQQLQVEIPPPKNLLELVSPLVWDFGNQSFSSIRIDEFLRNEHSDYLSEKPILNRPKKVFSPDRNIFLEIDFTGQAHVSHTVNQEVILNLQKPIKGGAFSWDNTLLATYDWDKNITLWTLNTQPPNQTSIQIQHQITSGAFTPNSKHLLSGDELGNLIIWNIQSQSIEQHLKIEHLPEPINDITVDKTGQYAVYIANNKRLYQITLDPNNWLNQSCLRFKAFDKQTMVNTYFPDTEAPAICSN